MCGPLCDAVLLGRAENGHPQGQPRTNADKPGSRFSVLDSSEAYSQLILDQLERANMFLVPLDDERRWYRYHHLFAEVLRARLFSGTTAGNVAALYNRASAWCEQAGLLGEAVRYAFLAQDVERAAVLIERHAMAQILASDVLLVRPWVEQVPRALILARPQLALIAGFVLALTGQFAAVERLLADAASIFHTPDLDSNIAGELAVLRAMIARIQEDVAGTYALSRQALAQLALDNHGFRAGAMLYLGVASMWRGELAAAQAALAEAAALAELGGSQWIALAALEELGSLQARHGLLRQVVRTCEQAVQLSERMGAQRIPAAGMGHVGSAEVLYEWNELAGAAQAATHGIGLLRGTVERLMLVRGYVVLAQVYQAQGNHEAALDSIDRCEAWFAQTPIGATGPARAWLAAHRARLYLRQGDRAAAARWERESAPAGDGELGYVQRLTLVRLRLAQSENVSAGQPLDEAQAMLAQLLPAIEARGWTRYLIECLMLQTVISLRQADQAGARDRIERALELAAPEGYLRLFVDEGAPMAALLAEIVRRSSPVAAYASTLLSAFPEGDRETGRISTSPVSLSPNLPSSRSLVEPLSAREIEILRLIAAGHSNQAIADTLIIAISTVKRHINNIYGKLGVQSRTQALARARELGLL
jgi:LuxR family maltose regulon positive regulatory protein